MNGTPRAPAARRWYSVSRDWWSTVTRPLLMARWKMRLGPGVG